MSRICTICEKKAQQAVSWTKTRSKYNPTNREKQYPNLQWLTLPNGKRVKACARCVKSAHKEKK